MSQVLIITLIIFAIIGMVSIVVFIAIFLYNKYPAFRNYCDTWSQSKFEDL